MFGLCQTIFIYPSEDFQPLSDDLHQSTRQKISRLSDDLHLPVRRTSLLLVRRRLFTVKFSVLLVKFSTAVRRFLIRQKKNYPSDWQPEGIYYQQQLFPLELEGNSCYRSGYHFALVWIWPCRAKPIEGNYRGKYILGDQAAEVFGVRW